VVDRFGTDPQHLLAMPVRLFWSMAGVIERLEAAQNLSLFDVMSVAQAGDAEIKNKFREALRQRLGHTSRVEKPRSSGADIMAALVELEG